MDARPISQAKRGRRWRTEHSSVLGYASLVPLVPPTPRSAMFFPLAVLVAVLPGLYALGQSWELDPPSPWWGLRGLAVIEGRIWDQEPAGAEIGLAAESAAYRAVSLQPPLYAWFEAMGLASTSRRDPIFVVFPSYVAGAVVVLLVYCHGRLRRGAGSALLAAAFVGLNPTLLAQSKLASPTTVGLACLIGALFALEKRSVADRAIWGAWVVLAGVLLGLAALAVGWFALTPLFVVALRWLVSAGGSSANESSLRTARSWKINPDLLAFGNACLFGTLICGFWFFWMSRVHGSDFWAALAAPPDALSRLAGPVRPDLWSRMAELAPAWVTLGLFGAGRTVWRLLRSDPAEGESVAEPFWFSWLVVAAFVPVFWHDAPRSLVDLFLLIPLSLFASVTIWEFCARRIAVRWLILIAPATASAMAWSSSSDLRDAIADLLSGHADYATALGLHLGLDLLIGSIVVARALDHWGRRKDSRRRAILAGFLLFVVASVVVPGMLEIGYRRRETRALVDLRRIVLRRHQSAPFTVVAVVGPGHSSASERHPARSAIPSLAPGGRLRFILRSTMPDLRQIDLTSVDELLTLPSRGRRLVVLLGAEEKLTYPLQSRLNLEAIHPGVAGVFGAFATTEQSKEQSDH